MQKSVDAIAVETWSTGYHQETDSVILTFEFEDSDEPLSLSMDRSVAGTIGDALLRIFRSEAPAEINTSATLSMKP